VKVAAACLALLAGPALGFDGTYGTCGATGAGAPIRIAGDVITFHEAQCQMTEPRLVRDMPGAVLFDFRCRSEGETWTERAFLQRIPDGVLILVWQGQAQELPYCGP